MRLGSTSRRIAVVGAGVSGLTAAIDLASLGHAVTLVEKERSAGGKMRTLEVAGRSIDAGPTVLTQRSVLDDLWARSGARLDDDVRLVRAQSLGRHVWADGSRLDLFPGLEANADAIGHFAGASEARAYRRFAAYAERAWRTSSRIFVGDDKPSLFTLAKRSLLLGADSVGLDPFRSMHAALRRYFRDPRLVALFGRYATYVGASPLLAPATLLAITHVEREGVWFVDGGMAALARALTARAEAVGVTLRYGSCATRIVTADGRVRGVELDRDEVLEAETVVFGGDVNALGSGSLGVPASRAAAFVAPKERSLSAMTYAITGKVSGFPLLRHTVFFPKRPEQEHEELWTERRFPRDPAVYVCAQDREDEEERSDAEPERLFLIVNAPPVGDARDRSREIDACEAALFSTLQRAGLTIEPIGRVRTTPEDFAQRYPATGGAIYGRVPHGLRAMLRRPGAKTRIPGLYLTGGSAHPGAGVPMVVTSGRIVAARIQKDFGSIDR